MKITIDYCPGILKKVNCFFQECGWGIAYDQALDTALEQTSRIFKEFLITPLVQNIKNPLHSLASANLESIYLIEEDISDILLDLIDNKIAEIVNTLLSKTEVENISKELASVLTLKSTKEHVSKFFKHFSVKDLFAEVYRLFNNEPLLEKQQFYLYFCDITVYKTTFPIFYIPLELERVPAGFEVSFDSTIYLNKKAIDYVVQEYNKVNEKTGSLKTIHDRVIYLSEEMQGHLIGTIDRIMREISDFFDLRNYLELDNPRDQNIKGMFVSISNSCYLSLFDKSDESLINDYEEILELLESGSSKLADSFNRLINSFIHDDPISLINEVESEWDETDTPNRLVHSTPIPLNSEQRQVISSLKNPNCKYVTVEGPPGTGKSHTITAVLFNAVIEGQSVLVLSDKKEALDVVENKISESINKVRIDKNFQNPILRLGKSGSTYNQILSTTSIKDIKTYHRAYKKEASSSRINKEEMINNLKNLLKKTIVNYEKIKLEDIEEFQLLEAKIHESDNYPLDFNEIFEKKDAVFDLKEIRNNVHALHKSISGENGPVVKIFANLNKNNQSLDSFQNFIRLLEIVEELKLENKNTQKVLANFYSFSEEDYQNLKTFIERYSEIKSDLFGFLFVRGKTKKLNREFKHTFSVKNIDQVHKSLKDLRHIVDFFDSALSHKRKKELSEGFDAGKSYFKNIHQLFTNDLINKNKENLEEIQETIAVIQKFVYCYQNTANQCELDLNSLSGIFKNKLSKYSDNEFVDLEKYISLNKQLESQFSSIPEFNYLDIKSTIEGLSTAQMTAILDERVINFYEDNRNTVKSLKEVIKSKKKFPKEDFIKLKSAFPCILAGIRDFAEYIPMEPDLFDLVIIDEASQVSIAQAFPALLRAKKVLVLGDRKQFSNVKSAHASTDTNKEYLNKLEKTFRKYVSDDVTKLTRSLSFLSRDDKI